MPPPGSRGGRRWLRGGASSGPRHSVRTWSVPGAVALGGYWRVRGRATLGARLEMAVSVGTSSCRSSWRTVCKSRHARRVPVSCTARCGRGPDWRRARRGSRPAASAAGPGGERLGPALLGALPDRLRVSQCLRLKRVARRQAPAHTAVGVALPLVEHSWDCRGALSGPRVESVGARLLGACVAVRCSVRGRDSPLALLGACITRCRSAR